MTAKAIERKKSRTLGIGNIAVAAMQVGRMRGRKRVGLIATSNFLPEEVIQLLLQIMALPNSDEARASASRILGKCNIHDKLIPLFVTWMRKRTENSVIPSKAAADLEFPSLEMVGMLSMSFPVEKLLDWTNNDEKKEELETKCLEMLDCLIHGGSNIGQMLSEETLAETGGILPKMLRCLRAGEFENLQCRAVEALKACHLNLWEEVTEALQEVFVEDGKVKVREQICNVLFGGDYERDTIMDTLVGLTSWLKCGELDLRMKGLQKCKELKLMNKHNIIVLEEVMRENLKHESEDVRGALLEAMMDGGLHGDYLCNDLEDLYQAILEVFKFDESPVVSEIAAKCMLKGSSTQSMCCVDVTGILGDWVSSLNRQDKYMLATRACIWVPSNFWTYVDVTTTSDRFKSFNIQKKLSVQAVLKLTDDDVHIGNVRLACMEFVLHLIKEGFR